MFYSYKHKTEKAEMTFKRIATKLVGVAIPVMMHRQKFKKLWPEANTRATWRVGRTYTAEGARVYCKLSG
jgi:hypothetical protein